MTTSANSVSSIFERIKSDRSRRVTALTGVGAVIILILLAIFVPNFIGIQNIVNVLEQVSSVGFYVLGLTLVMVVGGIDLSIPGVIMAGACLGGQVMVKTQSWFLGILLMLAVGLLFGVINGIAVAKAKMIPFIVTLSTLVLTQGIASWLSASTTIYGFPDSFFVFNSTIGIVPVGVIVFIAVAIILSIYLNRTKSGREYFMTGESIETARVSGIHVDRVTFMAYVLCGLLGGVGSIFLTARVGSATATMVGDTVQTDVIASCVIGGASLNGGKGSVIGSVLGLIFITIISNCINLLGISYYVGMVVKGFIIAIVIMLDVVRSRD